MVGEHGLPGLFPWILAFFTGYIATAGSIALPFRERRAGFCRSRRRPAASLKDAATGKVSILENDSRDISEPALPIAAQTTQTLRETKELASE